MRKNCKTVLSFEDNERKALMINVQMNHMESVVRYNYETTDGSFSKTENDPNNTVVALGSVWTHNCIFPFYSYQ
jgi:hypothetical protein